MKHKTAQLISGILLILLLNSCTAQKNKEAYCFSMVFEKSGDSALVTLYCKTPDESDNSGKMKNTKIYVQDKDFKTCINKFKNQKYDIYFNSIKAYYLSGKLSDKELREIAVILLDNTKYKTDNYIFSPASSNLQSISEYHKEAEKVCTDEGISRDNKKNYSPALKRLREHINN